MIKGSLQARKQQLVRDAIYEAAIKLFAVKGFDETTIEDVAQAAGVSRRSFFRYFRCKDDLLAQSVMGYQHILTAAIAGCPAGAAPLEIIREAVYAGAIYTSSQPLTRQVIKIASRSASARQAEQSRTMELAESLAFAFAKRVKNASRKDSKPRLLASLTVMIMNVAIVSWYRGEHQNVSVAATRVLGDLTRLFCKRQRPRPLTRHRAYPVRRGRIHTSPIKRSYRFTD